MLLPCRVQWLVGAAQRETAAAAAAGAMLQVMGSQLLCSRAHYTTDQVAVLLCWAAAAAAAVAAILICARVASILADVPLSCSSGVRGTLPFRVAPWPCRGRSCCVAQGSYHSSAAAACRQRAAAGCAQGAGQRGRCRGRQCAAAAQQQRQERVRRLDSLTEFGGATSCHFTVGGEEAALSSPSVTHTTLLASL